MFLHGGVLHLVFNLWILWQLGRLLEHLLGRIEFAIVYVASGLFSSLVSLWFHPVTVSVGASGALFGTLGALFAFLIHRYTVLSLEVFRKLRNNAILFLAYNVALGLLIESVDLAGHLGGFVAGFICGLLLVPLKSKSFASRVVWNCMIASGLASAFIFAVGSMPAAPSDLAEEVTRFRNVERACLKEYNTAAQRLSTNRISNRAFLEILKRNVLIRWRDAREQLPSMNDVPDSHAAFMSTLKNYIDAREESWVFLALAIRHNDQGKLAKHHEEWAKAEQLARELSQADIE
jgi:hypothetical protein